MDAESVHKGLKIFKLTNHKRYTDETYRNFLSSRPCCQERSVFQEKLSSGNLPGLCNIMRPFNWL